MQYAPVNNLSSLQYPQNSITQPEQVTMNSICAKSQPNCIYTASGELVCGINREESRGKCPDDSVKDNSIKYLDNNYFGRF